MALAVSKFCQRSRSVMAVMSEMVIGVVKSSSCCVLLA